MTPSEIAELLGVDAVMTSTFAHAKPLPDWVGILARANGGFVITTTLDASLELHDKGTKSLIWNYNQKLGGSSGSTPSKLVNILMRKASRKMPYSKKF
jgi:hypothetical protein